VGSRERLSTERIVKTHGWRRCFNLAGATAKRCPRSLRLRSGQALRVLGEGAGATNACTCEATLPHSETKSSPMPRSPAPVQPLREGRNDNCSTAMLPCVDQASLYWIAMQGRGTCSNQRLKQHGYHPETRALCGPKDLWNIRSAGDARGLHRSFVGSRPFRGRLRYLRMTTLEPNFRAAIRTHQ